MQVRFLTIQNAAQAVGAYSHKPLQLHILNNPRLSRLMLLIMLILCAYLLRIYHLDASPLRGDEAYSIMHWTAPPLSERWERLIREEPAPVGAFTLYWVWSGLTGRTEFAVRYLSVLGSVAGAAVIIALAKRLTGVWLLAFCAGGLYVVHPFLIWHAQDARTYGILSALTPLTFYWLLRAVDDVLRKHGRGLAMPNPGRFGQGRADVSPLRHWLPYIFLQTLAVYIYYFEPFWMAAQGIFILWLVWQEKNIQLLTAALRAWLIIGLLCIPVILQAYYLLFVSAYEGNAAAADAGLLFTWFVPTLLFGENRWSLPAGALAALILFGGLLWLVRKNQQVGMLLLVWVFVPPILLFGVSFFSSFFRPRYVMTVIPALLLTLVILPYMIGKSRRIAALMLVCGVFTGVSLLEVRDYFTVDPPKGADWPGLLTYLNARMTSDDALISDSIDPALEYYYDGPAQIVFLPKLETDPAEFMPAILADHTAIYLLAGERTGPTGQFLQANAQSIPGDTWPGVIQYRKWQVAPDEIALPLEINFGDIGRLRGYTVLPDAAILLYWEALNQTETEYSVLLHLETTPDAPQAVLDHAFAGAVISTRTWTPGTLYRDPVALPVELAAGTYTLRVSHKDRDGQPVANDAGDELRMAVGTLVIN